MKHSTSSTDDCTYIALSEFGVTISLDHTQIGNGLDEETVEQYRLQYEEHGDDAMPPLVVT